MPEPTIIYWGDLPTDQIRKIEIQLSKQHGISGMFDELFVPPRIIHISDNCENEIDNAVIMRQFNLILKEVKQMNQQYAELDRKVSLLVESHRQVRQELSDLKIAITEDDATPEEIAETIQRIDNAMAETETNVINDSGAGSMGSDAGEVSGEAETETNG